MSSSDTQNNNRKINEALELLNEAAREKKDELRHLLSDKYSHIKETLTDMAVTNQEILDRVKRNAELAYQEGEEKIKEALEDIDQEVRKNPWPYIGGAAAAALLLGYILGSSRR